VPLGSTATYETIEIPRSLWGRWEPPMTTGLKTLWIRKHSNTKQKNASDNQQPSGDKRNAKLEISTTIDLKTIEIEAVLGGRINKLAAYTRRAKDPLPEHKHKHIIRIDAEGYQEYRNNACQKRVSTETRGCRYDSK
jgi:hypothetical protein